MATHSSALAWRIPGTEEPGGLLSLGSHRVRHDWSNLAAAAAAVFLLLFSFWSWAQLFCNRLDCSLPDSYGHGISQARTLEWLPLPSPRDLPDPGIEPLSPALAGGLFTTESPGRPRDCSLKTHTVGNERMICCSRLTAGCFSPLFLGLKMATRPLQETPLGFATRQYDSVLS